MPEHTSRTSAAIHNYRDEAIVEMLRDYADDRAAEAHNLLVDSMRALELARAVAAAEVGRLRMEYQMTKELTRD